MGREHWEISRVERWIRIERYRPAGPRCGIEPAREIGIGGYRRYQLKPASRLLYFRAVCTSYYSQMSGLQLPAEVGGNADRATSMLRNKG